MVGIYFSAHWCPPCRGFTPKLVESYNTMKAAGKNFEIVFVSSDNDEAGFDEYYGAGPLIPRGARGNLRPKNQHREIRSVVHERKVTLLLFDPSPR